MPTKITADTPFVGPLLKFAVLKNDLRKLVLLHCYEYLTSSSYNSLGHSGAYLCRQDIRLI
jgi:hypothetical protein